MNSFVVKLFVFLTEVLSVIIIGTNILAGLFVMVNGTFYVGLAIAIGGTIVFTAIFGLAAILIEIHKDLRVIRAAAESKVL